MPATDAIRTFVATSNPGKLAEFEAIFADSPLVLCVYPGYRAVPEGERDYAENALLKARALRRTLQDAGIDGAVIADDSGLEVRALGGRPGVLSARYGGESATWEDRRALLLREMNEQPQQARAARFVSCIALVLPDGRTLVARGTLNGSIATASFGGGGFGYDPIFFYEPAQMTLAQMTPAEKNRCSHRYHAAQMLLTELTQRVG